MPDSIIKKYRHQAGMDQRQLADALRLSQAQMSRIESGIVPLSSEQLFFLADYFDAPEILLEHIQPFLDKALEMAGAASEPSEKCLLSLMADSMAEINTAIDSSNRDQAAAVTSRLICLAKVVRVLLGR